MPSHELQRVFDAPIETVSAAAHDALLALGSDVQESDDGRTLTGKTGFSLFSFGETVVITLAPEGDGTAVMVESSQRFRIALADLGKRNRRNVGSIMNSIATRLSASK